MSSKRRLSNRDLADIGSQRMARLLELSEEAVRAGRTDRARRYVDLARRIGMKTRTGMPKERRYCKECLAPMVPGVSCRTRLTGGRLTFTCLECGAVRRMPYIKEQRQ